MKTQELIDRYTKEIQILEEEIKTCLEIIHEIRTNTNVYVLDEPHVKTRLRVLEGKRNLLQQVIQDIEAINEQTKETPKNQLK